MLTFNKKLEKKCKLIVNPTKWVYVYDSEPIIYSTDNRDTIDALQARISTVTNINTKLDKDITELQTLLKQSKNQFKTGDVELTYTRLNGTVQTFMIDKDEQLSENFKVYEFMCPNCNTLILSELLVTIAQNVRDHFNAEVTITSGYRTQLYNDSLPGSWEKSLHIQGKAIDFKVKGISKTKELAYVKTIPNVKYTYTNNTNMAGAVHANI